MERSTSILRLARKFYCALGRAGRKLDHFQPFTIRGLVVIGAALLLYFILALPQQDLIANIISGGVLVVCAITVPAIYWIRFHLGRKLRAEIHFDQNEAISRKQLRAGIILYSSNIPPLFSLSVSRRFHQRGAHSPLHLVKGREKETEERRYLLDLVTFPHRGLWQVDGLQLSLGDAFGLTRLSWKLPVSGSVEVSAATIAIRPLPIVAASARSGDQLNQSKDRSGDPFDIKAYDPSDGIRKILWKTYAKSGQLMVRRPEPAVIPEGEVAIYLVAAKNDDVVAGALQSYLKQLVENQITIIFGTDGFAIENPPSATAPRQSALVNETEAFSTDPENIQRAINRSVWSPACGTGSGFSHYLESLISSKRYIERVIIFGPQRNDGWFERVRRIADGASVALTIALVPFEVDPFAQRQKLEEKRLTQLFNRSAARFGLPSSSEMSDLRRKQLLTATITRSGAELMLVQGVEGF